MGFNACEGLGEFGVLKVERKRFVPTRRCRACGLLVAGPNLKFEAGWPKCVACRRRIKRRWYWAMQMRAYFASAA